MSVEQPILEIDYSETSLDEGELTFGSSSVSTVLDISDPFVPDGALQSEILNEMMIKLLANTLPPRAEGYPWVPIYNSVRDGFCLSTLYRKMEPWLEVYSPVLLVVRDDQGHVFGAVISDALRQSEHYYGTADACFLFKFIESERLQEENKHDDLDNSTGSADLALKCFHWTGKNEFFIDSAKEFISIGGGQGKSGLWLDNNLNHGRSQKCETFDNDLLAGEEEEFRVQLLEAFGFHM